MKKIKYLLASVLLFLAVPIFAYAQSPYSCPSNSSNALNDSSEKMNLLIKSDDYSDQRNTQNIGHLKYYSIQTLQGSSYSCYKLNGFKSQNINLTPNTDYTYYQVNNYYFIVSWYTVKSTKYRNIFVLDSQYNLHSAWLM
ncbi:MAG: hypothetical protein ED557_09815 [Balneola sp.]|nr:MAG: hypothetical protein ED557_09815 [Balneola sp.]